jgi:hypothetical protein
MLRDPAQHTVPPPPVTQRLKVKDKFRALSRILEYRFQILKVFCKFFT